MPIRFRCPHCTRLLGIARRKAGSPIDCPQCARRVTVPFEDTGLDLDELDNLLNTATQPVGSPSVPSTPRLMVPEPEPSQPAIVLGRQRAGSPLSLPSARDKESTAKPAPSTPLPSPPRKMKSEDSLFEMDDVDAILGVKIPGGALDLDPDTGPKPVSGHDARSLDDAPDRIVLSPQKATLIAVAVFMLLGIAFASGFLVASNL